MHKHFRLALVVFISWFIAVAFIPAEAPITRPYQSADSNTLNSIQELSIKTLTMDNSIRVEVSFPRPTISTVSSRHIVEMQDLPRHGAPGEPILPFKIIRVLIPKGKKFQSVQIAHSVREPLKGRFNLEYGRTPTIIGSKPTVVDQPNQQIYSSANPFPTELFSQVSEQRFRGYEILLLTLHPVQYIPKTGGLFYFESMTVTVNLQESAKASPLLRNLPQDKLIVQEIVDNPEAAETYSTATPKLRPASVNASESYDYIIITDQTLNSSFQPLINSKILKGLNATTVLVEDILTDPDYFCDGTFGDGCASTFNDTAARIRNFIKDAYSNWGIEYVLLGGDVEIIPNRNFYGIVDTDPITVRQIPADLYYAGLDGSWDNDNDTVWGEGFYDQGPENATAGDEADFFAEVYVGRAPVNSQIEATNFVNKTLWYEQHSDDSYFKKAVMIGETLDEETEGGNSKDLVADKVPQYTHTRLYQRDGTFSKNAIISAINSGTHILNHDGHTNPSTMMEMSREDVDTLIDNTEYFLGYSIGCDCAAFEADDSIVEHFMFNPDGAFAFVANSRYGWYSPGTTFGAGDRFDREFFSVLNNTIQNLGKTLQFSKESFAGSINDVNRWTYYSLNLFGDPQLEIVTEIMAPQAQFETNPTAERLAPPIVKGLINLTGRAKRGTAVGATFSNYTIEFGSGTNPSSWTIHGIQLANNGQNEVVEALLATWNTNIVTPGTYTLRLTARDASGTIGEDRWIVRVRELPAIRVKPQLTQTYEGLTFTVSAEITDPEDLFRLDFKMRWNATLLEYLSHDVYMPVETYWWGVLHDPVQITKNEVNETAGTYWIAAASSSYTPTDRDGIVFNMTFQAKASGTCNVEILSSNLTDRDGHPITHKVVNGTVEIAPGIHDLAVTDISTPKTVVGQTQPLKISVTIANEGTFTENFNVTVYANGTIAHTAQIALTGLNSTTLTLVWDTTGWTKGNYTISVNVTIVEGETDTADNTMENGKICVTIPGDVDGDRDVDIFDIVRMAGAYGTQEGQPGYDPECDLDGDGDVDIFDIVMAAGNYGESW